jgi:uncharacterized RDD family membrane protein YckC
VANRLERINRFLDGAERERREIVTPEGVALEIELANRGERALAFVIDMFFWAMAILFLALVLGALIAGRVNGAVAITLVLFAGFLLRNFYFIHFELTTQGATPGKRIVGLKVIDAIGGPLTPSAVVARNLTREVETFLPLALFVSLQGGGGNWWMRAAYVGWLGIVSALPFFNRDRRRAGDFLAGTLVIAMPKRGLLADLGAERPAYVFTRPQLETYGAFELQVLEEVLRRRPSPDTNAALAQICARICAKIGWSGAPPLDEARAFLNAFYIAERAHLERAQLFGKYRADKSSPAGPA